MAEIPYTWGWTLLKFNDEVRNDSGFANDIIDWTDEDVLYTVYWNKLYANFAHTGYLSQNNTHYVQYCDIIFVNISSTDHLTNLQKVW